MGFDGFIGFPDDFCSDLTPLPPPHPFTGFDGNEVSEIADSNSSLVLNTAISLSWRGLVMDGIRAISIYGPSLLIDLAFSFWSLITLLPLLSLLPPFVTSHAISTMHDYSDPCVSPVFRSSSLAGCR